MSEARIQRPPPPPTAEEEAKLSQLLRWSFRDELHRKPQTSPPAEWGGVAFGVPRKSGGILAALQFSRDDARGVLVMGHPAVPEGKGWFHLNNRVPFARNLGLNVVTFDHGGFGESDGPTSLYASEWDDILGWARRRYPTLPLHAWGVGLGGYFLHHALARDPGVAAAIYEHVPAANPPGLGRAGRLAARLVAPRVRAWLPAEAHAPFVHAERMLYVFGGRDPDVPQADAERLWHAAGPLARRVVAPDAGALEAWAKGGVDVREAIERALA